MNNARTRSRSCITSPACVTLLVETVVFDAAGSGLTEDSARLRTHTRSDLPQSEVAVAPKRRETVISSPTIDGLSAGPDHGWGVIVHGVAPKTGDDS